MNLVDFVTLQYCYDYLITQIPVALLLYSHIPTALAALVFGGYVLSRLRTLPSATLFIVCASFAAWCLFDLGSWFSFLGAAEMMFMWSLLDLFALIFFLFSYYFLYTFLTGKDLPIWQKTIGVLLILPTAVTTLLGMNLTLYDANICEAWEHSVITLYPYFVEGIILIATLVFSILFYHKTTDKTHRKETVLASIGVLLFLGFFFLATLGVALLVDYDIGEYAYNFEIYGLFGMPILLIYLGYLIVRYKAFNLKIFGAQALIFALVALIGSQFTFVTTLTNQILVAITLLFVGFIGIVLIRSVRREIVQRERIEGLAKDLSETNRRQESLIHFISHEVKGFLTKDMMAFAALSEGDAGTLDTTAKTYVTTALAQTRDEVRSVMDILQASNMKKGTMAYHKEVFDLAQVAEEIVAKAKVLAEQKNLTFAFSVAQENAPFTINGDRPQIGDHVLRNLIENAINYTPAGGVTVSLSKTNGKIVFTVQDTGVGISAEDRKNLFTEGGRGKDSTKVNVHSTGYGLYIAKSVVDAHNGTIRAESDGPGKGSRFIVELPALA